MISQKALETFGNWDKKSLLAGITVGQGLKGRARAPQNPAPAGFPQELWDAANRRAANMIAALAAEESGETPEEPSGDWEFDKDAFCFGVAAGRSLEGWEIDGGTNLGWENDVAYYIHLDQPRTVTTNFDFPYRLQAFIDWGDGTDLEILDNVRDIQEPSHSYETSGDYIIRVLATNMIILEGLYWRARYPCVYALTADGIDRSILHSAYLNITIVRNDAFLGCTNLKTATFSPLIQEIEKDAWIASGISDIYYNETINNFASITSSSTLGFSAYPFNSAAIHCSDLTITSLGRTGNVVVPHNITTLGFVLFGKTNTASAVIHGSVKSIISAFHSCYNLTEVVIENGVIEISDYAFEDCSALVSVTIPDSVTSIGEYAFSRCQALTSVTIPDSVKSIGRNAFDHCRALTSVAIPDGVTSISQYTFSFCTALTSVTIPDSVTSIETWAFAACRALTDVYYKGSEEQRNAIAVVATANDSLTSATWHYNSTGPNDTHDD